MNKSFKSAIDKYLQTCKNGNWVKDEAYKFEFANFLYNNVDWQSQTDKEILNIFLESQKIQYTGARGIQFILKSGKEKLSEFIAQHDIKLIRQVLKKEIVEIDWSNRTMSYTALSAWIASLFPEKFFPIPATGFDQTIKYLFGSAKEKFPKTGLNYIFECQPYLNETWNMLSQYPFEDICLREWNNYYKEHSELNIPVKTELSQVDKVWLVQDFHLFVYRNILELFKKKVRKFSVQETNELTIVEGNSILAQHIRYERNNAFIKKIKEKALAENKMLNCEICGFSFLENYGEIGQGFIEAHHKNPLAETKEKRVTKREDIALVCSNCHKMLHRGSQVLQVEELKKLMNNL